MNLFEIKVKAVAQLTQVVDLGEELNAIFHENTQPITKQEFEARAKAKAEKQAKEQRRIASLKYGVSQFVW